MTDSEPNLPDLKMDAANLYREEVFSDQQIGTIRRMTPVTGSGDTDPDRIVRYVGQTQLMTPAGALPLTFEIEADSLDAAVSNFGQFAEAALEQTMEELQEMRRQQASSIVVPGAGNMPGGNKIQMP
jgi:hypothetical protein